MGSVPGSEMRRRSRDAKASRCQRSKARRHDGNATTLHRHSGASLMRAVRPARAPISRAGRCDRCWYYWRLASARRLRMAVKAAVSSWSSCGASTVRGQESLRI